MSLTIQRRRNHRRRCTRCKSIRRRRIGPATVFDEEVIGVEVAMVVAGGVKSRDLRHLANKPPQVWITPGGGRPRGKATPQEVLQLDVAGQFLGQEERFDHAVRAEPLAVGHQPHHVDAQQRERAGDWASARAGETPQPARSFARNTLEKVRT